MATSRIVKCILDDMQKTITELYNKNLIRDYRGISDSQNGKGTYEISYSGKNATASIVYDKHVSGKDIMQALLKELQYTVLLYDKSIIQAEYKIENSGIEQRPKQAVWFYVLLSTPDNFINHYFIVI